MNISKYEYTAISFWRSRMIVRFRLLLSEGKNPNYKTAAYTSRDGANVGFADLSGEAMLILKHVPYKNDKSPVGEVMIPPRRIYDFAKVTSEISEILYGTKPCFVKYDDGNVIPTSEASEKEWFVTDLPLDRILRLTLCPAPDESGNPARVPGVMFQIQNSDSVSLLPWNDFMAFHSFLSGIRMELVTPSLMQMLYYVNLIDMFEKIQKG